MRDLIPCRESVVVTHVNGVMHWKTLCYWTQFPHNLRILKIVVCFRFSTHMWPKPKMKLGSSCRAREIINCALCRNSPQIEKFPKTPFLSLRREQVHIQCLGTIQKNLIPWCGRIQKNLRVTTDWIRERHSASTLYSMACKRDTLLNVDDECIYWQQGVRANASHSGVVLLSQRSHLNNSASCCTVLMQAGVHQFCLWWVRGFFKFSHHTVKSQWRGGVQEQN